MPYNGAGNFVALPPPDYPAVAGELIKAASFNAIITDLMTGLSNAITRDGQSPPTANLPMGGQRFTGAGDAVSPQDFLTKRQIGSTAAGEGAALVGYLPAGTGATGTTVQSKLREVVSVLDFGADPTGVADSTAAIQAAIDSISAASAAGRGEVHFPAGTYKVSTLVLAYGVSLLGQYGRAVKLVTTTNAPVIRWSASIPSYSRNITIKGFWMIGDGIASGKTSQTAIRIDHPWGIDGLTLQDLYIDGFNGYAIETAQQGSGTITNCFQFSQWSDIQIHNCGDGILMGVGFCGESEFHNIVVQVCTNTCITFSISGTGVGPQGLTFDTLVLGGAPIGLNFTAASAGVITFNNLHAENVPTVCKTNSATLSALVFDKCWFVNFATRALQGVLGGNITFANCLWSNTILTPTDFINLAAASNFLINFVGTQTVSGNLPASQIVTTDINTVRGSYIRTSATNGTLSTTFQTYLGVQVRGIMSETATVRPNNLSGATAIANGGTSVAITFARAETDAAYKIAATVDWGASAPPAWAHNLQVGSKTTAGFSVTFGAAAPAGGASLNWVLTR